MTAKVAALFVYADGVYNIDGIDCWDIERDARLYDGNLPVIAHPPCQLWGKFAPINYARWGGEHNRPANDGGCFAAALAAVNRCGGVLEHPQASKAWEHFGLQRPPSAGGWARSGEGWTCEVYQSAYGHKARKATWLYYVGAQPPYALNWARPKGTHQIGFYDQRGKTSNKPTLSKAEANATPLAFRDELIFLALYSTRKDGQAPAPLRDSDI